MTGTGPGSQPPRDRELLPRRVALYAAGELGINLLTELQLVWLIEFYTEGAPPSPLTDRNVATLGILMALGRLCGGIVDPLVGHWSDRTRGRFGRRLPFIVLGAVPWVVFSWLCYAPPWPRDSTPSVVWAGGAFVLFTVLSSVISGPYLAMLPEIARTDDGRLRVSLLQSVFRLGGIAVAGVGIPLAIGAFGYGRAAGLCSAAALVTTVAVAWGPRGAVGAEPEPPARLSLASSVWETLRSRNFRFYAGAFGLAWVGLRMVVATVPSYSRVALGVTHEGQMAPFFAVWIGAAALASVFVPRLARRWTRIGLFRTSLGALGIALLFLIPAGLGVLPGPGLLWFCATLAAVGLASGVLFTVPYTILANIIDEDAARLGARREAVFFGVQALVVKAAWGAGDVATTHLTASLGRSADRPWGVYGICAVAGALCLVACWLAGRYRTERTTPDPTAGPTGSEGGSPPVANPDSVRRT